MSQLLSHEDYLALAASLRFPVNAFIDGRSQPARSGKTFKSINPATSKVLAKLAACQVEDVDFSVSAEDLNLVAQQVVQAAFGNMGENGSATSRLIVQTDVKAALLERVHARDWRTGDPTDTANHLGALIDGDHFNKVCSYLDSNWIDLSNRATDEAVD